MKYELRTISLDSLEEALSKAQLYRFLNEPEEAESICQDVLAADPENQAALRTLGLVITDQFSGIASDRHTEVKTIFARLSDPYDRHYCLGLLYERRAKAQMRAAVPAKAWIPLLHDAMREFEEAERLRPRGNDEAILRWNRCVRILQGVPHVISERIEESPLIDEDSAPHEAWRSTRAK